ncbi:type I restriction-modification system subunit M N-terminal domain-containing protein [Fontivita pretiosa]|uniref:type I restriction-modification system subunit M N-terminal domain-containing protein n=1 Tax=Fontivita pretiosa TaxID=2989684 RepID=UPI003D1785A1
MTEFRCADVLRGRVDAAEYKHVVLGLIFLKYIFDPFKCWAPPRATRADIAILVDDAILADERNNWSLHADYILTNPPFNVSDWGVRRLRDSEGVTETLRAAWQKNQEKLDATKEQRHQAPDRIL